MKLLEEIKKGENIELYLVIVLSTIVLGLDIFGDVNLDSLTEVILAILIFLAIGTLTTRRKLENLNGLLKQLSTKVENLLPNQKVLDYGIVSVHPQRPTDIFTQKCEFATSRIYILTTQLSSAQPIPASIFSAADRNVDVRILLLKPDSPFIMQRSFDAGLTKNSDRPKVLFDTLVTIIKRKMKEPKEKIHLRLYEALPPFGFYLVDDWISLGLFWHGIGSIDAPHIELFNSEVGLGKMALETFKNIWERAEDFDFKNYGEAD